MTQTSKTKKGLYGLLAAIGVTGGAAGIAVAVTSQSSPSTTATATAEKGTGTHDEGDESPTYTSSIVDKASGNETEGTAENDAAEAARLEKLATVTPDEAKAAALAAQPGKAGKVELGSENGNVVYDVEVATSKGTVDVKIDAGNAKVLQTEKDDGEKGDDKSGDHEKDDGNETESGAEASGGTANG
ncbi:MAG: hypothetical protein JWM47_247 [Acidimicrobiales bacterium]|nr:hypothetical protein [Acidimicrobiales bacterium]